MNNVINKTNGKIYNSIEIDLEEGIINVSINIMFGGIKLYMKKNINELQSI